MRFLLSILWTTLVVNVVPVALGDDPAPAKDRSRTPWTASRLTGTPEPPLPFTIEPAFPKLKFVSPVALTQAPGSDRLFVAELGGKFYSFPNDPTAGRSDLVIDLASEHKGFGQFYGFAFHPKFAQNRYVYLCYTMAGDKPDGTIVARFTMIDQADPPRIDPQSEVPIITWLAGGHNGGCLQFGPDGFLYISTGDAAPPSPPDIFDTGQNIKDLLSSVLRIDIDGATEGRAYSVPPDNPFLSIPGARPEVWAFGLRNPWRMSFDRVNGDLWVGDVGWELWEMIYRVRRGGNYGWSVTEGPQAVRPESKRGPTPILPPIISHPHSEAASITGGYVYRGSRLKPLIGTYIYGDYQSGKVWGLRLDGEVLGWHAPLAETGLRLVSFGDDNTGELYLIEMERTNQIYRLVPNEAVATTQAFPKLLSETGLFASTKDHIPMSGVIPYAVNTELWADGAWGERLLAVPGSGRISPDHDGRWKAPEGTVLAKTNGIDLVAGDPQSRKRLETQILHFEEGSWRPYAYLWNDDQTDARLVDTSGMNLPLVVKDSQAPGGRRELNYRIASRSECVLCHNPWVEAGTTVFGRQSASPLGFHSAQLDTGGVGAKNQLRKLEQLGLLQPTSRPAPRRLTNPYDEKAPVADRARSYLQVNCAHCHQFNAGGTATILLTASLPLAKTNTVDAAPLQGLFGIENGRIIASGEPDRSLLYYRIAKSGSGRMPRVGSQHVDAKATRLIADWIAGLPRTADPSTSSAETTKSMRALSSTDSAERTDAIRHLLGSTRAALALVAAIDHGEISNSTLGEVAQAAKASTRGEVADLFDRFLPDHDRVKRLGDGFDRAAVLALAGDAERGHALFLSDSATSCKLCHRIPGGEKSLIGPDLSEIAAKYNRADLLLHIVEPSREVAPAYVTRLVTTKDGLVQVGQFVEKTAEHLVLRDSQGRVTRIALAEIEDDLPQARSLMPEGLMRDLTPQQAADLLHFLATLKKD